MMASRDSSVHYASNVYHYDEALVALRSHFARVHLQRRFEPSSEFVKRLGKVPGARGVVTRLERRVRDEPDDVKLSGFGAAPLAFPLLGMLGMAAPPRIVSWANHSSALSVLRELSYVNLFQFVEGLGHAALESAASRFDVSVMERRNLHHEVFEQELEVYLGFPQRVRQDPLRDFLDIEYSLVDRIIVYSPVAAQSFIDRGYDRSRISTVPLAVSPPMLSISLTSPARDRFHFAYVGRGDAYKGLDVAVAAVRSLGRPYRLTVAGPTTRAVREWLSGFPEVDYVGVLSRAELGLLYQRVAALIAPSVESFGLAIVDAAAYGTRILCRETTGAAAYLPPAICTVLSGRSLETWTEAVQAASEDIAVGDHFGDRIDLDLLPTPARSTAAFAELYEQLGFSRH